MATWCGKWDDPGSSAAAAAAMRLTALACATCGTTGATAASKGAWRRRWKLILPQHSAIFFTSAAHFGCGGERPFTQRRTPTPTRAATSGTRTSPIMITIYIISYTALLQMLLADLRNLQRIITSITVMMGIRGSEYMPMVMSTASTGCQDTVTHQSFVIFITINFAIIGLIGRVGKAMTMQVVWMRWILSGPRHSQWTWTR
jgi:hypothetical protein